MIKTALISVSDKTGIVDFAKELEKRGVRIISTGGTHRVLQEAGVAVTGISDVTGFPECLDGRVKTLHPKIHAGLLSVRTNPAHMEQIASLGIDTIDMVVVNLYPFKKTVEKPDVTLEEAIENIDIGGPSMLRSAAKNFAGVVVLTDPADYAGVLREWDETRDVSYDTRFRLSAKVYGHTAYYDGMIAAYMNQVRGDDSFRDVMALPFEKVQEMRYGENPHQKAAFYREPIPASCSLAVAEQLHGKELSYNNINDANGALDLLREFGAERAAVVAVKHANPCGVGLGDTVLEAYLHAYNADPVSIFGGIVACNREVDADTAEQISKIFLEIVIAPSFTAEALEIMEAKKNIRILRLPGILDPLPRGYRDMKRVAGGLLVQEYNRSLFTGPGLSAQEAATADADTLLQAYGMTVVTQKRPTADQIREMIFGMKVVKHAKSNAIVVVSGDATVGVGPGQTNRIGAAEIAFRMAGDRTKGAVLASDAFFPFDDCVTAAAEAGIAAIVQPGGSKNDDQSVAACDRAGIAMVFTGMRHFKH